MVIGLLGYVRPCANTPGPASASIAALAASTKERRVALEVACMSLSLRFSEFIKRLRSRRVCNATGQQAACVVVHDAAAMLVENLDA